MSLWWLHSAIELQATGVNVMVSGIVYYSGILQGKQTATPRAAQHYEVHDDVILQLDAQLSAAKMHVASPSAGSPGRAKLAWWQTPLET